MLWVNLVMKVNEELKDPKVAMAYLDLKDQPEHLETL